MSEYETAEQRQIRELRNQISSMNSQAYRQSSENNLLRQQLENVRRQQEAENARIMQRIQSQQQTIQQQQQTLQQQNQAIQQERAHMSSAIQSLDRELKEKERLQNEKIRSMQSQYTQQIASMNTHFQQEQQGLRQEINHVREANQKTQDELYRTQAEMRTGFAEIKQETDRKLQNQREQLRREIAHESARLESEISAVDARVQSITAQLANEKNYSKELATYWLQEAERLIRELEDTYRDSLFDRRRMEIIRQKLDNAKQDIDMGQPAIVPAREAFQDAMRMKEDLAELEMEWNYWYNALRNEEQQLLDDLDSANHRIYVFDNDGERIEYNNGIDYWTNGQLSVVTSRIEKLRQQMGALDSATIDDLKEYEEQMRSLIEELALIENASHINVAMSLSRFQTAVKIGEILGEEFEMVESDGDFFREENREEYHAIFQNPLTGDRVAVVITPVPDEAGVVQNHIELIADNGMDNDSENRVRIHNIVSRRLSENGVQDMHLERCAGRHGNNTQEVIERAGNIAAVVAGDERVRVAAPSKSNGTNSVTEQVRRESK